MHVIDKQQKKLSGDLNAAHRDEVNRIKLTHHEIMEKKIADIQSQLKSVLELSKTYWDQHADEHKIKIDLDYINDLRYQEETKDENSKKT